MRPKKFKNTQSILGQRLSGWDILKEIPSDRNARNWCIGGIVSFIFPVFTLFSNILPQVNKQGISVFYISSAILIVCSPLAFKCGWNDARLKAQQRAYRHSLKP